MKLNKTRPPLNSLDFSGGLVCVRPFFFDFNKNFLYNIIEGRTKSDTSFTRKFKYRKEYIMYSKKTKKIDIRLTAKEKEEIQE